MKNSKKKNKIGVCLGISETEIQKELPSTFVQLRQLLYLWVDEWTRLPDGFGNLKCLQELLEFDITSPTELGRLTELRCLDIVFRNWEERYEEPFLQCLSNLVSLESLRISDSAIHAVPRNLKKFRCNRKNQKSITTAAQFHPISVIPRKNQKNY